jgi:RHS repeat-associated protein
MGIMQTASPTSPVRPTHRPRASHRAGSLQHAGSLHRARPTTRVPRRTTCIASNRSYRTSQRSSRFAMENLKWCFHRNQQYSVIALTNGGGTITERYAYGAYGTPTITDASGAVQTSSVGNNRCNYTGREYDKRLALYHYRARVYDSVAGRFCSRDPIGYFGSQWNLQQYVYGRALTLFDPSGLQPPGTMPPTTAPGGPTFPIPGPTITPGKLPPGIAPNGPIPFPKRPIPLPRPPTRLPRGRSWHWVWFDLCRELGTKIDEMGEISKSCLEHDCEAYLDELNSGIPSPPVAPPEPSESCPEDECWCCDFTNEGGASAGRGLVTANCGCRPAAECGELSEWGTGGCVEYGTADGESTNIVKPDNGPFGR